MKNTINVIDQELIDWFDEAVLDSGFLNFFDADKKAKQLLTMAKDLIEINAELTKENQKQKGAIEFLASEDELRDLDQSSRHWSVIDEVINNSGV